MEFNKDYIHELSHDLLLLYHLDSIKNGINYCLATYHLSQVDKPKRPTFRGSLSRGFSLALFSEGDSFPPGERPHSAPQTFMGFAGTVVSFLDRGFFLICVLPNDMDESRGTSSFCLPSDCLKSPFGQV